jgi:D,D-heptose 1,7-bisphosphate phosphatase
VVRQAVILAGGKGERLASRLGGRPKPLVDVLGAPLLARQIDALAAAGVSDVIVLVSHEADQIEAFVATRSWPGVAVAVVDDSGPRGTAGAVLNVENRLDDDFLVVYGDTLFDLDLTRLIAFHQADAQAAATLVVHPNDHPWDSDLIEVDEAGVIAAFHAPPHAPDAWLPNLVNAALYVVRSKALGAWRDSGAARRPADFARDVFPALIAAGERLRAYATSEYIKDIGTPERLDRACADLAGGKVARATLRHPQRAVFLDRDGVLNASTGHVARPDQLDVYPFAGEAVRLINRAELRAVLVTNQPVIARGECTARGLAQIHAKLETILGRDGAYLDAIYYCPHHPDGGFSGEVAALKRDCECRKPKPGLLLRAAADLNIDLAQSWMIGDTARDLMAARACGVRFVLVRGGEGDADLEAQSDLAFDDVVAAATFIAGAAR